MKPLMTRTGRAPKCLTPREAADELRIGTTKLYDMMNTGELRSVKIGKARRVLVSEVDRLLGIKDQAAA